jgi:hypothetical protein
VQILADGVDEQKIEKLLKGVPVKLGGDKTKISLFDIMPSACVRDLVSSCEKFVR